MCLGSKPTPRKPTPSSLLVVLTYTKRCGVAQGPHLPSQEGPPFYLVQVAINLSARLVDGLDRRAAQLKLTAGLQGHTLPLVGETNVPAGGEGV